MNTLIRHATIVSTFALMTAATAGLASAQESYGDQNSNGGQGNYCAENPEQCGTRHMRKYDQGDEGDQGYTRKRRIQKDQVTVQPDLPRRHAQSDWQFDPRKHRRHRNRTSEFRFEFGGFWYPEPYWQGYGYGLAVRPYRIGCGEGRAIVRDQGFYRVRTVECNGRAYTYIGRRHGETF